MPVRLNDDASHEAVKFNALFGLFRGKDSKIRIAEPCVLQQLSQRSPFQISVAVDWYGQNRRISRLRINMMTAMDAL